ncbi:MAG TPA: PadR family transcriptional regulator [Gemmatimonadales bacterium]|nr:PadR family transcriptional regulator [Gemmatimonadales bacterium]
MSETPALKPREFAILLALAGGPRHGYAIMQALRRDPAEPLPIGPATLYRTLRDLERAGLLSGSEGPSDSEGPPRRYFQLTAVGRRAGSREAERMAALASRWRGATG